MQPTDKPSEIASTLDSQASRTVTIILHNKTDLDLYLNSTNLNCSYGQFRENNYPYGFIAAGSTGRFICESNGFASGAAGRVNYNIGDSSFNRGTVDSQSWIYITWDNPYAGINSWDVDWFDYQGNGQHKNSHRFKVTLNNTPHSQNDMVVEYTFEHI